MAKINEQKISLTMSKLIRSSEDDDVILNDEALAGIIEALQQMVGEEVLIELE